MSTMPVGQFSTRASLPRSIAAVLAGFVAIVVLSLGMDQVLHALKVYPAWGAPMSDRLFLVATAYRILFSVAGCYITARLAPQRPMKHAVVLGIVGIVVSLAGALATWNRPEMGPHWYPIGLVVVSLPCAWLGGKLRVRQLDAR